MIVAIIQARQGSTRLPNKVLLPLKDKTILEHCVNRTKKSKYINKVIVATTHDSDEIKRLCFDKKIDYFIGNESDVLDRYYQCALAYNPTHIVRVTSDCPCIDPNVIDDVIKMHLRDDNDLTSNCITETFPDGLDCEIFKYKLLVEAWNYSVKKSDREHVTVWMKRQKYKIGELKCHNNYNGKRWTIDEESDYRFLTVIFNELGNDFRMKDVISYLELYPEIEEINSNIMRNEGYYKSLERDK